MPANPEDSKTVAGGRGPQGRYPRFANQINCIASWRDARSSADAALPPLPGPCRGRCVFSNIDRWCRPCGPQPPATGWHPSRMRAPLSTPVRAGATHARAAFAESSGRTSERPLRRKPSGTVPILRSPRSKARDVPLSLDGFRTGTKSNCKRTNRRTRPCFTKQSGLISAKKCRARAARRSHVHTSSPEGNLGSRKELRTKAALEQVRPLPPRHNSAHCKCERG